MEITTDFLTAKPTPKSWSGVFGYKPDKSTQVKFLGEMFGVVSIKSPIDFDLANLGSLIMDELHDSYYVTVTEPAELNHFESAFASVEKRIAQIMEREPKLAEEGVDFEMLVVVIREGVLYIGAVGESKIVIARGEDAAEISGVLIDAALNGFVRTASLQLEPDDRLLLVTSDAYSEIGETKINSAIDVCNLGALTQQKAGSMVLLGYELTPEFIESLESQFETDDSENDQIPTQNILTPKSDQIQEDKQDLDQDLEVTEDQDMDIDAALDIVADTVARAVSGDSELDTDDLDEDYQDYEEELGLVGRIKEKALDLIWLLRSKMQRNPVDIDLDEEPGELEYDLEDDSDQQDNLELDQELDSDLDSEIPDEFDRLGRLRHSHPLTQPNTQHDLEIDEEYQEIEYGSRKEMLLDKVSNLKDKLADTFSGLRDSAILANVVSRGKEYANKAQTQLRDIRHGRPGSREAYVRSGRTPKPGIETKWKILGVVLLVAAVVVGLGLRQAGIDNEIREYQQSILDQVATYETQLDNLTIRVSDLSIGEQDPSQVARLISDLDALSRAATTLKSEEIGVNELNNIISQVQTQKDTLLRVNAFSQPQIVADMAVNFQGVDTFDIEYSRGNLFVTDSGRGVIYKLGVGIGSEIVNFVTGLDNPSLLTVQKDGDLVFRDNGSEGVIGTVDIETGTVRRQPGLNAAAIGELSAMFVWTNNQAMYGISQNKRAIVKRDFTANNYTLGDGDVWRRDNNFADGIDIAVNGSVYVLVQGQGIKRYYAGQPASFTVQGLTADLQSGVDNAIAFELTSNKAYLLDRQGNRIIVLSLINANKAIYQFEEQIVYRGSESIFTDLRDFVVVKSSSSEQLFVLDGSKVIRIDR